MKGTAVQFMVLTALSGALLWCAPSSAKVITSLDVTATSVQNAVNSASDGDVVKVPPGSATWSSQIVINKAIQLVGAGIDSTIITMSGNGPVLSLSPNGKFLLVSGFTWNDNNSAAHYGGIITVHGGSNWRICSNRFNIYYFGIQIWGGDKASGLIDRNACYQLAANASANFYSINGNTNAWNFGPAYGSPNTVYIEHNQISFINAGNGAGDSYNGARFVFRYNSVTNCWIDNHGCDSGGYRSPHSMEIYGNTLAFTSTLYAGVVLRGGTGLIFSNTIIGPMPKSGVLLQCFRYGGAGSVCASSLGNCMPWGLMNGSNPYDGNSTGDGYPGLDQVGRSGPTTFSPSNSTQVLSPVYCWGNTPGFKAVGGSGNIISGRDFYNDIPAPDYKPLSDPHPLAQASGVASSSSGTIATLTADSGVISSPFVVSNGVVSQPLTTGVTNGGVAAYNVVIPTQGSYLISAVVSAPSVTANSFYVNVDDVPTDPNMIWDIPVTSGFQSRTVSWRGGSTNGVSQFSPKVFSLSAGGHILWIFGRQADVGLSSITVTRLPDPPGGLKIAGS